MQCISYRKNERIARHRSIDARMARVRASPRCYHGLACRPLDRSAKADRRKRGDEFVAMRSALARARQPATWGRATERARNRQACAHFAGPPRRATAPDGSPESTVTLPAWTTRGEAKLASGVRAFARGSNRRTPPARQHRFVERRQGERNSRSDLERRLDGRVPWVRGGAPTDLSFETASMP